MRDAAKTQRRNVKTPAPGSMPGASTMLCAWQIDGDYWHVQSRDPWLSGVLLDMGMKRIARAIKGGHLHIFETRGGFETVRPLMRRHRGRILR